MKIASFNINNINRRLKNLPGPSRRHRRLVRQRRMSGQAAHRPRAS
jgi:exonuclease III